MNYTEQFIEGLYSITQSELPSKLQVNAKKCLIDYLGVALAGAKVLREKEDAFLNSSIEEGDATTIIGCHRRFCNIEKSKFHNR